MSFLWLIAKLPLLTCHFQRIRSRNSPACSILIWTNHWTNWSHLSCGIMSLHLWWLLLPCTLSTALDQSLTLWLYWSLPSCQLSLFQSCTRSTRSRSIKDSLVLWRALTILPDSELLWWFWMMWLFSDFNSCSFF